MMSDKNSVVAIFQELTPFTSRSARARIERPPSPSRLEASAKSTKRIKRAE